MCGIAVAAVLAFERPWDSTAASAGVTAVRQATLRPGEILLVLSNRSEESARVAQIILNDAFVDFYQTEPEVKPGGTEQITISYPWISGESYDVRLMTSSGATVEYSIDDAHAGTLQA
ncbi:MAG: zinc transporter, family [Gaiellaceae bacterium]|nr:zinc transporter, family [Gaiellaceae bacterium]MDX6401490.1 zinc transporter, family [Gaiellaceae bacterium]